ncbi:MAG TPA: ABC transporter permease [Jiangellaceae bacterium]
MSSTLLPVGFGLGVAMVLLVGVAVVTARVGRLGHSRAVLTASLRAVVQLAGVALILAAVVDSPVLTVGFVIVMYAAASVTAGRRVTRRRASWAVVPVVVSTLPVLLTLLGTGVLPAQALAVIPVAGILIGGAMTATALAGRRALDDLSTRRGEVEAALSLGLPPRDAALEICRPAASSALVPVTDQTRTVGLVTLPGAFVGMLLGGASPVQAGAVQLFVLVALLAVETVAVVVTVELVARGHLTRQDPFAGS